MEILNEHEFKKLVKRGSDDLITLDIKITKGTVGLQLHQTGSNRENLPTEFHFSDWIKLFIVSIKSLIMFICNLTYLL